jgi:hypothetical protein
MSWSYATGVLTSTGATEASPDSLLAGIAVVQAADATRAYRNGQVAWINNCLIVIPIGTFVKHDDFSQVLFLGSSGIKGPSTVITGGFIGGVGATLVINSTTSSSFQPFGTGSTFITTRNNPQDPSYTVVHTGTVRVDFPTMGTTNVVYNLAKIDINGLDLYANTSSINIFSTRIYARATTVSIKDIRSFDRFRNLSQSLFLYDGTYTNLYSENLGFSSELNLTSTVILNSPTFYSAVPVPLSGLIRQCRFTARNPTFLNNCWDGSASFSSNGISSLGTLSIVYGFKNIFKLGLNTLEGVNVRLVRARQSVSGTPTWVLPSGTVTAVSDASGTFAQVDLLDAYRSGVSLTDLERFNWTAKARRFDRRTAGETIFSSRIFYQPSVSLSSGYTEEVQMLTLANAPASLDAGLAITGVAFDSLGNCTLSQNRTALEIFHAWCSKSSQDLDIPDSWRFENGVLQTAAVTVDGINRISGSIVSNGGLLYSSGALNNLNVTGNVYQAFAVDAENLSNVAITGNLVFNTSTSKTIALSNTTITGTVANDGSGLITLVLDENSSVGIAGTNISVTVQCTLSRFDGGVFNLVGRYGTTGAYTDLGYYTNSSSKTFNVPFGQPVEIAMWSEGYLSFARIFSTSGGGFAFEADMIPEPDVDTTLNVSTYLAGITVSNAGGFFTATFAGDMSVPGIETTKAVVHRLLGLENAMRALLPPGSATIIEIEPDEIQINLPGVFLVLGAGASNVEIAGFFNTAPAKLIDPGYVINPRRVSDNLRVEIPLIKPALDIAAMAAAVRAEMATELGRIDVATSTRSTLAAGAAMMLTGEYDAAKTAATQASVTALGTPAQAAALATLATNNQAEHDATQAAIAARPDAPTLAEIEASTVLAKAADLADLATSDQVTGLASQASVDALAGDVPTASETADAVLGASVEAGATVAQSLRLANAVLAGKVSGAQTGVETFRDLADTRDVIVSINDEAGNRTAVSKNLG